MLIYPAIDLRDRQVVRLARGDFGAATVYGDDSLEVARRFETQGATWVHIVDLDGARAGRPMQTDLVTAVVNNTALKVQTGGGIRSYEDAVAILEAGVHRVVLGTAAVRDPKMLERLVQRYGDRIAVGIDAKGGMAAVEAWTASSSQSALEVAKRAKGLGATCFIVTDIATDGMLSGPGLQLLNSVGETIGSGLIASGGVGSLEDLAAVRDIPAVEGVIIGRALYEGRVHLAEAIGRFST